MSGTNQGLVQIDARELQTYRELGNLLGKAWNDPDEGVAVQRALKKIKPDLQTMDDNPVVRAANKAREASDAKVTALQTAFDEYKTAAEQKEQEHALRRQLGDVQTKRGLTDEGMTKVIELMQERKLADPDAAALLYLDTIPKSKPQGGANKYFESSKLNLFGTQSPDEAWRQLHESPDDFFAGVVNQVFEEMPPGTGA